MLETMDPRESFTRRPGSGRPRQTSRREDRYIVRNARVQPTASSTAVQAQPTASSTAVQAQPTASSTAIQAQVAPSLEAPVSYHTKVPG
ncbi:hypothetical protein TNCV_3391441 [Trichonephila clavipes]|nr:hypothetical protein TNCV_3391441 [Trichonephila clavipes]